MIPLKTERLKNEWYGQSFIWFSKLIDSHLCNLGKHESVFSHKYHSPAEINRQIDCVQCGPVYFR